MRIFETAFLKTETNKPEAGAGAAFRCFQMLAGAAE